MEPSTIFSGGLSDPAIQSAVAFRAAMGAMARPGTIEAMEGALAPQPLSEAAATLILVLCDPDTGLSLLGSYDTKEIRSWVAFHTSAPIVSPSAADFALGAWSELQPVTQFSVGTPEYPDRSCTLIVERECLEPAGATLSGPGLEKAVDFNLPMSAAFTRNREHFPLGFDCFFTAGSNIAALPRSTHVTLPSSGRGT